MPVHSARMRFVSAPTFPGWSLPLVGQDYLEILSAWYCSFGKCCKTGDCRIINNITGGCCSLLCCCRSSKKSILASDACKRHFWGEEGLSHVLLLITHLQFLDCKKACSVHCCGLQQPCLHLAVPCAQGSIWPQVSQDPCASPCRCHSFAIPETSAFHTVCWVVRGAQEILQKALGLQCPV